MHIPRQSACLLLVSVISTSAMAQTSEIRITHGPYLQALTETSVTIVWTTDKEAVSWVEYGTGGNFGSFPTYGGVVQTAQHSEHGLIEAFTTTHRITIGELDAGQTYRYRVFSKHIQEFKPYEVAYGGSVASDVLEFSTLDPEKESFAFGVLTDIHEAGARVDSVLGAMALDELDLMFYTGDEIHYYEEDSQLFDGFVDVSVKHFASRIPMVYVRGNHETRGKYARRLMDYFPTRNGRFYYSFNHGPVHFIVLDSGEDKVDSHPVYAGLVDFDRYREEQAAWLERDMESEGFRNSVYQVALFHIPPFGTRDAHGALHVRETWNDVLNRAGIDLVINGHTHRFARHDADERHHYPILINGRDTRARVDVSRGELRVTVTGEDGVVVDEFVIPAVGRPASGS